MFVLMSITTDAVANISELSLAIENVRDKCNGISNELNHLKTMAGINTAVTGVGTLSSGVGFGTGIAKAGVDKKADELEKQLEKFLNEPHPDKLEYIPVGNSVPSNFKDMGTVRLDVNDLSENQNETDIENLKTELANKTKQSKTLGNIRTGTMGVAAATNIAGAVIAGTNRVHDDLALRINQCVGAVKQLQHVRMQARLDTDADAAQLAHAEKIEKKCAEYQYIDISAINSKSTGATISSGVGAVMGLAGTITSAVANGNGVRNDNTQSGKSKETNLNTTANIMAGGTTIAGGVATVFNATQIGTIKKSISIAAECEEVLK